MFRSPVRLAPVTFWRGKKDVLGYCLSKRFCLNSESMDKLKEIELLRSKIQKRREHALSQSGYQFDAELRRFWKFLLDSPRITKIMDDLSSGFPEIEQTHSEMVLRGKYQQTDTEEEKIAMCYFVVKKCAESTAWNPASKAGMSFLSNNRIEDKIGEGLNKFKENCLEPLIDCIDEELEKASMSVSESRCLTILKTDMKGFTKRSTNQSRDEMKKSVEAHIALLTQLINKKNGHVFKTEGDSVLASFESPTDALHAAKIIQRQLRKNNSKLSETSRVDVRISINTGEVTVKADGDLLGDAINIVARLESKTPAGEIYFTEATRLVMKRSEIRYRDDVGEMKLRGISERVKVLRAIQ